MLHLRFREPYVRGPSESARYKCAAHDASEPRTPRRRSCARRSTLTRIRHSATFVVRQKLAPHKLKQNAFINLYF